ncbi:hypothetical protein [Nesterenkonia alkaliphila]|uniref:Ribbon-helix-helix protein, CopG family n=1 Tax=Nesterenkonia alkaliphila TaxID=1463631 RepID=A0A7K1UMH7_9MICC|nr:hypothetical protein [Nesterenkonia alkaliphila]MVT27695.1 hypothetical protein [Nesterenkonia alkaliphila]GFZ87832.1 hypothetical protein GCM10011359_16450 [Nesterenkonia alkaliphila]
MTVTVEGGSTAGSTMEAMGVVKKSVSLPADLAAQIEKHAEAEGKTFSSWLAEHAEHRVRILEGLAAVEEYEATYGPIPQWAQDQAEEILRGERDQFEDPGQAGDVQKEAA